MSDRSQGISLLEALRFLEQRLGGNDTDNSAVHGQVIPSLRDIVLRRVVDISLLERL